jgi:hypothetical protein
MTEGFIRNHFPFTFLHFSFYIYLINKPAMKKEVKRRDFISSCFKAGVACCALSYGTTLAGQDPAKKQDSKPDPKNLEYCGYKCPGDCTLKKGTLENNTELKKKAYQEFKFKEKYNMDFESEKVFCYGCKSAGNKPVSLPVKSCTVRKCVMEKGLDSCIQCEGLAKCEKELWTNFPKFRDSVIELQKRYKS